MKAKEAKKRWHVIYVGELSDSGIKGENSPKSLIWRAEAFYLKFPGIRIDYSENKYLSSGGKISMANAKITIKSTSRTLKAQQRAIEHLKSSIKKNPERFRGKISVLKGRFDNYIELLK